jgi:hypothetical protein
MFWTGNWKAARRWLKSTEVVSRSSVGHLIVSKMLMCGSVCIHSHTVQCGIQNM